ncbi:MAG TPA: glutamate synthase (NADPH), homotetrameric [Firmicutes bacterium]|jgi:glutamate synthase (NADPH) small chain|nr:glutamate synthase (NADPH), homotetrameric [Bacillota bacterium]
MPSLPNDRVKMPEQDPNVRNKNFSEVALGYNPEAAIAEAKRCLNCKNAKCVSGCPVNVPIPEFIHKIAGGDFKEAYETLFTQNALPAICGRVCPQENQCEGQCIKGIKGEAVAIGRLERFAADFTMNDPALNRSIPQKPPAKPTGPKVAIVGSGPAGLTCAGELARKGYDVTIFEALHEPGGVLMYGIPEFRLPKALVKKEIAKLNNLGVAIIPNVIIGKSITIDELLADGFKAVFIGSGAGLPKFMGIPGENLNGVYSANEFLTRSNLMKAYDQESPTPIFVGKNVAVIGGGNVAMDAARTAKRLGAEKSYIIYRRGEAELPARKEESHHAKEEGIIFKFLSYPTAIIGENGWVSGLECIDMALGPPDHSGRRSPIAKEGSEHLLAMDTVIVAIGQSPNPLIRQSTPGIATQKWGGIIVHEDTMATDKTGVYAGGDAVSGAATVISAMGAGKKAAAAIEQYLS